MVMQTFSEKQMKLLASDLKKNKLTKFVVHEKL